MIVEERVGVTNRDVFGLSTMFAEFAFWQPTFLKIGFLLIPQKSILVTWNASLILVTVLIDRNETNCNTTQKCCEVRIKRLIFVKENLDFRIPKDK